MKKFLGLTLHKVAPYLVLILGFFTYFINYEKPPNLYWDENYYVTAVEKYKKNIFFQESHPPLGKLIMYAGEKFWDPNKDLYLDFEKTDFARNIPEGYSFKGVRFFPVFFAWINCLLFFVLLLTVTKSSAWALSLSLLYAMDNALIVHNRGAMLDSTQLFGVLLALIAYFKIFTLGRFSKRWASLLGLGIAWATWTKLNGLIIILLLPLLIFYPKQNKLSEKIKAILPSWGIASATILLFSILVWGLHFSNGKRIEPALNNAGWYRASTELKLIKENPTEHNNPVKNFYIELRDYLGYIGNYSTGVPRLNLCKIGENGSPFFWWPLGARTINYRWETKNSGKEVSYLYLVPNPVNWGLAFIAVILSFAFFLMKYLLGGLKMEKDDEHHLTVMFILYVAYMLSIARIDRVMYTYHYFIPLIFSFVLVAKWLPFIVTRIKLNKIKNKEVIAQLLVMFSITAAWNFYGPFTYYRPISCQDFQKRSLPGWQMKPVQCNDYKNTSIYQPSSAAVESKEGRPAANKAITGAITLPPTRPKDPLSGLKIPGLNLRKNQRNTSSLPSNPQR